jgi:hypothetical protein
MFFFKGSLNPEGQLFEVEMSMCLTPKHLKPRLRHGCGDLHRSYQFPRYRGFSSDRQHRGHPAWNQVCLYPHELARNRPLNAWRMWVLFVPLTLL